ncbi:MAG: 50S ribosome-binding GTPase [Candidatus Thermoplasmatota archaeon]|jgi:nucleolar GTP-binding protein|nr:50S ribosome-binding GTPase [Candidatus Thermoplasmatota archaeon]
MGEKNRGSYKGTVKFLRFIPTVLRSDELIDKSLKKAAKIEEPYDKIFENRVRKENIDRIATAESVAAPYLQRLVKRFPSIEKLHPFYEDFIELKFGVDNYKKALNNVNWASEKLVSLATENINELKKARKPFQMVEIRKKYYGRFCSVIEHISDDLLLLGQCRDFLRKLPEIDPLLPTYIIAGMPNVGKSSLLNTLTMNNFKTASYPFTTQTVFTGFMEEDGVRVQLIDTPGILDRPMAERNELERRSILSLKDIKGVILFLMDHSGTSGYTVEQQEKLYLEIKDTFHKKIYRVQTKIDISTRVEDIAISNVNKEGLEELRNFIFIHAGEMIDTGY